MNKTRKYLGILILLLIPALPLSNAMGAEPLNQLKESIDKVIDVLNNRELKRPENKEKRRAAIMDIIKDRFDFREMSKRALALNWRNRTPEEKEEFIPLFRNLLQRTYVKRIESYSREKINYTGESIQDGFATVKTLIITEEGRQTPVDYKMMNENGKWMVYDVIIEGVSLVNNYRTQFNQIISTGSYSELVRKMKSREGGLKSPK